MCFPSMSRLSGENVYVSRQTPFRFENKGPSCAALRSWRRSTAAALVATATFIGGFAYPAHAQGGYPTRQVRVIVAFAPGGIADVIARVIGQKLSATLGQTFVIENRSGAGGELGAKVVSSAPSDGYTLLATTSAVAINAVAMKGPVDPRTQLTPIAVIAVAPMIFVANKDVTAPDLMTYIRDVKKGRFTYSSAGVGTAEHLTSEYIYRKTPGLEATHVPYAGGVEAVNAVVNKTVDLATATIPSALSLMRSGDLHLLAVASHERLKSLPNVPTLKEVGFADVATASWIAIFGPPGLSPPIAHNLNSEINAALGDPDVSNKLAGLGFVAQPQSQEAFKASLDTEVAKWGEITKTVGFSLN
jgi:tripartite-type tricarboxylate transporter receptor subunit TctC